MREIERIRDDLDKGYTVTRYGNIKSLHEQMLKDIKYLNDLAKKDAQNIINAWDWTPDGTHTVETAQVWVSQKLKPVIEGIRNKLNDH